MLFAFDIQSRAIMLVAGDKAGNWTKWYATNIPIADRLFTEHQEKLKKEAEAAKAAKPQTRKGKKR
ncbi:Putative toxin HigB2 [Mycobacterium attenuatum]|nr:Putative toxin HigB2 [Mycobacterium attenuatum]